MDNQRLTIVFVVTILDYGGAQTQLLQLSVQLKKLGWDVRVVSMRFPQALTEEFAAATIPVASLDMPKGVPDPRGVCRLAKLLRQWQPDVVHSHLVHANLLARVTRLLCWVPVLISTAHNFNEGGRWREIAYRLTDSLCNLTTNVSQAATERYVQIGAVPAHKIIFMPNSIDPNYFSPNPESRTSIRDELDLNSRFVWLAIGRLEPQKDYPTLLNAFAEVFRQFPQMILLILGKGALKNQLELLTKTLGLSEQVRFLGIRQDIPQILNAADAYVMSSAWEGMPGVLLEASAVGLPIVATDVGGNREVVLEGKSGFFVPAQNAKALAQAMEKLIELPETERQTMGKVGRNHVIDAYSLTDVVNKWERLYKNLLNRQPI